MEEQIMNDIRICEQISFLRRQKGITQETLARHFGVTNQTVSKWESGQCYPDIQLLPQIADYFGISVDELMGHTPAASLEALCLTLKKYFTDLPEAKADQLEGKGLRKGMLGNMGPVRVERYRRPGCQGRKRDPVC